MATTIPIEAYLDSARVFHWATKRHFLLFLTGSEPRRHGRTEIVLRRLVKRKMLRAVRYEKGLIYCLPRKSKGEGRLTKVKHGLACTECLVRFYRSKTDGEIIPERFFFGLGAVPEWGIRYPKGTLLLLEFCTKDNFYYSGNIKGKVQAYRDNLWRIEEKFKARAMVIFVCDVERSAVEREVGSVAPLLDEGDGFPSYPFYFVDYESFLKVEMGQALQSEVYFFLDGRNYSL
jgi:hypothetical protein